MDTIMEIQERLRRREYIETFGFFWCLSALSEIGDKDLLCGCFNSSLRSFPLVEACLWKYIKL
ncbi:hypothetical protein ACS0TY_016684 [Phlomoides rotata]